MKIRALAALCALLSGSLAAQTAPAAMVSAEWLRAHLADRNLVLLHVGTRPGYDSVHIPGARYFTFGDFAADSSGGRVLELPAPQRLDSVLEVRGVADDSRIVVYAADGWFTPTARAYLTLVWAGLEGRASLLDGGLPAWRAAGGRVTADTVPVPTRGRLTLTPRSDIVVSADWVAARLDRPDVAVIDARNERFYVGNYPPNPRGDGDPRPGHIRGAFSLPFTSMSDSAGRYTRVERLRELFGAAGAAPGDTVVVYCHIGQQASAVWLGARLAGYQARLYDGSFTEWSRLTGAQYPVVRQ